VEEVFRPHYLSFALLVFLIAAHSLEACSVPQPPDDPQPSPPITDLIAGSHYRRAAAVLDATPLAPEATPQDIAQRQYLQSRVALGLGQYEQSLQLAEKAAASDPQNAAYHVQVAAAAGRIAQHASLFKQLTFAKRAKKELDDALALEPKRPDAIYGMMMFHEYAPPLIGGDKATAQKLAEDLTALDPARGYLAQATLAHERKDAASELALIQKAVAAAPDSYNAHMAYAALLKNDPYAAEEQTCLALLLDPTRAEAWQSLAELSVASACWPELTGLIQTAQRFNPDDDSPAYSAAVAMIAAGKNLNTAQTLLTRYLEKTPEGDAPSPGRAHYQLALISQKRGQTQDALFHLHAALDLDPTMEDARQDLKRLERAN
jgi:tetratricopeptide (TPR) repeat protein